MTDKEIYDKAIESASYGFQSMAQLIRMIPIDDLREMYGEENEEEEED